MSEKTQTLREAAKDLVACLPIDFGAPDAATAMKWEGAFNRLQDALARSEQEREEIVAVLESTYDHSDYCTFCGAGTVRRRDHSPDCRLASLLKKLKEGR